MAPSDIFFRQRLLVCPLIQCILLSYFSLIGSFLINIFKRVVALDLRGFNESDKPKEVHSYKIANVIADLKAFVEYLGIQYLFSLKKSFKFFFQIVCYF